MEKINNFNSDLFLSESEYDGNDGDYNDNEVTKYHDKQSNCKPKTKKKYRTSASESTVKKKKRSKKVSDVMSNVNKEKEASTSNANYDSDYPQSFNEMNNDPDFEMKHTSHDSFYDFNKDAQIDRIRETSPFSIEASASNISKGIKQHRLSSDDDTDNDDQKRRSNSYDDHEDNEDDRRGGFLHLGNLKYNIDKNTEKNRQILYEDFNKEQFESSYEMAESFSDDAPTFNISNSSKIKYNESFENDKLLKRSKNSDENSAKKLCLGKVGNTSITTGSATNGKGKAERMMEKMGYQAGKGLGKNNQGRLEPVQTSTQHGRRGIGLSYPELEAARLKWNPDEEIVQIKEEMEWLKNTHRHIPTIKEMHDWMVLGPKKETIDDETKFCEAKIVEDILNSKTIFDKINKTEKRKARTRSNPYETIRNAFFLNRAAVKMANMDKACDFLFTKPNNLKNNELLYFADLCLVLVDLVNTFCGEKSGMLKDLVLL